MNVEKLKQLLAEYATENPERRLADVTVIEFSEWYALREAGNRLLDSWDRYEAWNRSRPPEEQRD